MFQNFSHSQVLPVKGNRAPAAFPLESSLNNCTPSKIPLQVCLVPTDLQIISLQYVKENLQMTHFVPQKNMKANGAQLHVDSPAFMQHPFSYFSPRISLSPPVT